jgi:hypothetical protein
MRQYLDLTQFGGNEARQSNIKKKKRIQMRGAKVFRQTATPPFWSSKSNKKET